MADHAANYRGKNLLLLMLAIGAPAALLYLRLVFGYMEAESQLAHVPSPYVPWLSKATLALFFIVQLIAARYVQRLLKSRETWIAIALQYVAVLLLCTLMSLTGAVILEAFGFSFFVRSARAHRL